MTKKLKIRFIKFERALAMQILEQKGEFKDTKHVFLEDSPFLLTGAIFLRGFDRSLDFRVCNTQTLTSNKARDQYLEQIIRWISKEQFSLDGRLEIGKKLEVKSNVNFSGKERSNDGGINLTYREDVDARVGTAGKIKVPDFVELELQAFEGGEKMKLRARFYFKLSGGAVLFSVKILNLRETILKNFREVCDKIAEDTGLPIHYTK